MPGDNKNWYADQKRQLDTIQRIERNVPTAPPPRVAPRVTATSVGAQYRTSNNTIFHGGVGRGHMEAGFSTPTSGDVCNIL